MNITEIKLMKRKNLGNYEHEEMTFTASLVEGEDVKGAIIELKELMHAALENDIIALEKVATAPTTQVEKVELKPLGTEPVATANIVKEKAAPRRAKAAKTEEVSGTSISADTNTLDNGQAIPPVITEAAPSQNAGGTSTVVGSVDTANVTHLQSEAPKATPSVAGKGVVAYDATIKEHRSRFATYLGTNYPKWKTCRPEQEIKDFSKGLHGKAFEDAKGNMLDSFKADLEVFFASAK